MRRYLHFCDCGPHFHCGTVIIQLFCEECGAEYLGPDCNITQPLPVALRENGRILCVECFQSIQVKEMAFSKTAY